MAMMNAKMNRKAKKRIKTYIKGRVFEYKVRDFFKNLGFYVIRSAKSGSDFDLVAIREGNVYLIQCKACNKLPSEKMRLLAQELKVNTIHITKITSYKAHMYIFKPNGEEKVTEVNI